MPAVPVPSFFAGAVPSLARAAMMVLSLQYPKRIRLTADSMTTKTLQLLTGLLMLSACARPDPTFQVVRIKAVAGRTADLARGAEGVVDQIEENQKRIELMVNDSRSSLRGAEAYAGRAHNSRY